MFAYGMNTNRASMRARCPHAQSLGAAQLLDHRFRFAVHADVEPLLGSVVDGVLWEITEACLESLDMFEAYPVYYNRAPLQVKFKDQYCEAITYFMVEGHGDSGPYPHYLDTILEGYAEHKVPNQQVINALSRFDAVAKIQHRICPEMTKAL
jgi:gamma-glutamylcyclotransferase (GGCT)/AIG2-like uncharacterized protein YtfP